MEPILSSSSSHENDFRCNLCNTCFMTKPKYEYHSIFCRWRHTPPKIRESDYNSNEKKLTDNQRDRLLRDLLYQVQQMHGEIKQLKQKVSHFTKKEKTNILNWLNQSREHIPSQTFRQWILSIPVTSVHLEKAFHSDLVQGMCESMKDAIDSISNRHNIFPFCAFIQNTKIIYIYRENRISETAKSAWIILDKEECKKMVHLLSYRFFQSFIQWQKEHAHLVKSNIEWQEKEMIYSKKIIGQDVCENTRNQRIFEWIYSYIQQKWVEPPVMIESTD